MEMSHETNRIECMISFGRSLPIPVASFQRCVSVNFVAGENRELDGVDHGFVKFHGYTLLEEVN